eukprot:TRINITY_DN21292_c0_g1_i1.p1 TRINITY_DN21292_c0_g1~~TRINITY_DN21292_c0_g1_i1.p1  ORF type:complete len:600 (+),score=235.38 TRINITY_DN21292_c0_g1_i1:60-1802(+)
MSGFGVVFSDSCGNEFQWRNLYMWRYGVCTYRLHSWKDTYLARERCRSFPLLRWVLDADYDFEHIFLLLTLSARWGPGVQSQITDDLILLWQRNTASTNQMLCRIVDKACSVQYQEGSEHGVFGRQALVNVLMRRYCKIHGAAFVRKWLRPVLTDSAHGLFSPTSILQGGIGSAATPTSAAGEEREKAVGQLFLRQLERQRAQDARRQNRAILSATESLTRRLRNQRNELPAGIWLLAVLAQRRYNQSALEFLDVPGFDIRMISVPGAKEAGNPVAREIVSHVVLRHLLLDTWLLPALAAPEEWIGDGQEQASPLRRIEMANWGSQEEPGLPRARRMAQSREQLHLALSRTVLSISVETPAAVAAASALDAGGLRVQKELEGWLADLMTFQHPTCEAEEVVLTQEGQEAALVHLDKMLRRHADSIVQALTDVLPAHSRDVLVARLRSVLRECDADQCQKRQQQRDDVRRRMEDKRRGRGRSQKRPQSPTSPSTARLPRATSRSTLRSIPSARSMRRVSVGSSRRSSRASIDAESVLQPDDEPSILLSTPVQQPLPAPPPRDPDHKPRPPQLSAGLVVPTI